MNHKVSRKIVSCLLAVVMIFSISCSAFAADDDYEYPVVIVNGIANNPIFANPGTATADQIFPPDKVTSYTLVAEMCVSMIQALASNNYTETLNYFVGNNLYGLSALQNIQLNPDGTSMSENVGSIIYNKSLAYYGMDEYGKTTEENTEVIAGSLGAGMAKRIGADNVYVYTYDWRIDPLDNAKGLNDFVQTVKAQSNKEKVSIISEGFGSSIATAYLSLCHENAAADVDNFVTVNSAFEGSSLIGDIFTGRLIRQYNEINSYTSAIIRYINDISDNPATWFAGWLSTYILNKNWEMQDFAAQVITMMGHIRDPLYDNYLRDLIKNFTGLWAMVPVEYFDEAMDFMFIDDASTAGDYNSELQERVQAYKNLQGTASEILNKAKSDGINVSVISSWNIQIAPMGDNKSSEDELFGLSAQSDGLIDTYYSSFGAYTIPLNDVGAAVQHKDQISKEGECANHNHLSAEFDALNPELSLSGIAHYIDASTCALPDNTWFIRNLKYGSFETDGNSMDIIEYLATTNEDTTVFTNPLYPQFLNCDRYVDPIAVGISTYNPGDADYMLGDVNIDGKVTASDARDALRITARLEEYPAATSTQFKNADVNGDGVITAADARIILRVTAGLSDFSDFRGTSDLEEK